ncbi:PorT family protein [Mucilaginibacter limnophilus]|uniref:PorT family protein n=1 Tax=Mucilaginibacter limnophilus TaxID=1932778 RepID=A0A437MKB2_9SPHI|nr:porin family protein [Mucilaginibacter limnophilus]RVT98081.1 PorT family protein [Mucilaginibacter limnophilus]
MKKVLLTICLAAATLTTFAQAPTFGIKGGVNFAKLQISAEGTDMTASSGNNTLFNAGVFVDFKFDKVSVQPGLFATAKGGKFSSNLMDDEGNALQDASAKFNLLYLQVPVNVVYHAPVTGGEFFFGAGPFVGYGISGKATANDGSSSQSEDVNFGDDGEFKTIDAGVNGIAGFKFANGFLLNLNYDLGLTNIANNSGDGRIKTRVFGISVGYQF